MRFHDPQWLWLLLVLLPWIPHLRRQEEGDPALAMADGGLLRKLPVTSRARLAPYLPYLGLLALALAIVALARPQAVTRETTVEGKGVDLIIALDLSTSMLAEDSAMPPPRKNRLAMAKEVLSGFLDGRPGDRMGLVVFAARPYPAAPLTLDHAWLRDAVQRLGAGTIEDGTALGEAILAALNRLRGKPGTQREGAREERGASQAIILITDGRSNAGLTPPLLAAQAARTLGIRIHAIGIGSRGSSLIPMDDPLGGTVYRQVRADLDEATLREVAATTGGSYFRADDRGGLERVFREIDRLEKKPLEYKRYDSYTELFPALLLAALALWALELALGATWLRRLP